MYGLSERNRHETSKGFAAGLIVGALLGGAAALLWAPASGDETRKVLRRNARRLSERGRDAISDIGEDAERTARRLARQGRKYAARTRDAAGDLLDEGRRYTQR